MQNQEFLVLGSQTLSELKNHIYCLTNKLMDTAGVHDNSGYFLIEVTPFPVSYLCYSYFIQWLTV